MTWQVVQQVNGRLVASSFPGVVSGLSKATRAWEPESALWGLLVHLSEQPYRWARSLLEWSRKQKGAVENWEGGLVGGREMWPKGSKPWCVGIEGPREQRGGWAFSKWGREGEGHSSVNGPDVVVKCIGSGTSLPGLKPSLPQLLAE